MARRRRDDTTLFDIWFEFLKDMPTWVGPVVAISALPMSPACPVCGAGMVRRIARNGANAGSQFWGCPKYPACRGIRQVAPS